MSSLVACAVDSPLAVGVGADVVVADGDARGVPAARRGILSQRRGIRLRYCRVRVQRDNRRSWSLLLHCDRFVVTATPMGDGTRRRRRSFDGSCRSSLTTCGRWLPWSLSKSSAATNVLLEVALLRGDSSGKSIQGTCSWNRVPLSGRRLQRPVLCVWRSRRFALGSQHPVRDRRSCRITPPCMQCRRRPLPDWPGRPITDVERRCRQY